MHDLHRLWLERQRAHEGYALRRLAVNVLSCGVLGFIVWEAAARGDVVAAGVCAGVALLNLAVAGAWLRLAAAARRNRRWK